MGTSAELSYTKTDTRSYSTVVTTLALKSPPNSLDGILFDLQDTHSRVRSPIETESHIRNHLLDLPLIISLCVRWVSFAVPPADDMTPVATGEVTSQEQYQSSHDAWEHRDLRPSSVVL